MCLSLFQEGVGGAEVHMNEVGIGEVLRVCRVKPSHVKVCRRPPISLLYLVFDHLIVISYYLNDKLFGIVQTFIIFLVFSGCTLKTPNPQNSELLKL